MDSECIRVRLLGSLEVQRRNQDGIWSLVEREAWGKPKHARSVLKRLLAAPGRRLSRGQIQDDLWPEIEMGLADSYLYNAITKIRGAIGRELVSNNDSIYEIAGQGVVWTDIDQVDALMREIEDQGHLFAGAIVLLEEALGYLERGAALEGEEGTWCYGIRRKAEDMLRQARIWLAEAYDTQGKIWQAGEQYRALVQAAPDEEAALAWMGMLVRRGKRQDASRCYEEMRATWELFSDEFEQQARDLLASPRPAALPVHTLDVSAWSGSSVLGSLPVLPGEPLDQILALDGPLPVDKDTLQHFAALTDTCRHLSEGNELRIAERVLWTYLPKIEQLAQHRSDYQQDAAAIASQGYLLAASLVGHRNDLLGRLRYSKQALHYGDLASDLNLQIVSMRQIAISFDNMDCPEQVIEISQRTLPRLCEASPLLQSCIYAGMSGAYAELGQKNETQQFMDQAYERFPAHPENEPGYLHTICRYSTLVFFDGLNALGLGEPRAAEAILARLEGSHSGSPLPERVRIEMLNYQIAVFLALGDMERACTYLETATEAARAIGSERHFREDFSLLRQMQQVWRNEPRVQALTDLFVR